LTRGLPQNLPEFGNRQDLVPVVDHRMAVGTDRGEIVDRIDRVTLIDPLYLSS
jgi:hypothetical protein